VTADARVHSGNSEYNCTVSGFVKNA